jgi:hypothetical protein
MIEAKKKLKTDRKIPISQATSTQVDVRVNVILSPEGNRGNELFF